MFPSPCTTWRSRGPGKSPGKSDIPSGKHTKKLLKIVIYSGFTQKMVIFHTYVSFEHNEHNEHNEHSEHNEHLNPIPLLLTPPNNKNYGPSPILENLRLANLNFQSIPFRQQFKNDATICGFHPLIIKLVNTRVFFIRVHLLRSKRCFFN